MKEFLVSYLMNITFVACARGRAQVPVPLILKKNSADACITAGIGASHVSHLQAFLSEYWITIESYTRCKNLDNNIIRNFFMI